MKNKAVMFLSLVVFTAMVSACGPALPYGYNVNGLRSQFDNWEACYNYHVNRGESPLQCADLW